MNPFTRLRAWWLSFRESLAFGREAQRIHAECVKADDEYTDYMLKHGGYKNGIHYSALPLTPEEVNAILSDPRSVD